jgi:hypothetical protein
MTNRVFVYGTLKRRYPNNPLLEGSEFLGEAVTAPTYKMVTCKMVETRFPVIMPDPSGKQVAGEIYAVDDATLPLSNGDRLPTHAFIYVGREDRFGEMFARGPLYEQANERGELDWRAC